MLYAKRKRPDDSDPQGLEEHSWDVLRAATTIFGDGDTPSRVAVAWLRFFRLDIERWGMFRLNLAACALLHDIGKANDGFQLAMTRGGDHQLLRHEHLSALILALPTLRAWLAANVLLMPELVISAIACHHLKASKQPPSRAGYPAFAEPYSGNDRNILVIQEPEALRGFLDGVARYLDLPPPPDVPTLWTVDGSRGQDLDQAKRQVEQLFRSMQRRQADNLLPALKAALIVADAAGSGLAREHRDIKTWISATFEGAPALTRADIEEQVLGKRIAEIEFRRRIKEPGYVFRYHDFQDGAALLPARALLIAPCGLGKTLAAWRWIGSRLDAQPASRVLFLYPTRATATEGFKDYVSHAPETDATLLSATAAYELKDMFANPDDPRGERCYETDARLFAVGVWQKRLFSATVDQFLGFMQQVYRSTCLLPVLADSIIVVDEVHSFDSGLFSTLTRFLDAFDVPVLCMTASLPAGRREQLQRRGFAVYPHDLAAFRDLKERARASRYRVCTIADHAEAQQIAEHALKRDLRVLWVVNTVDRCQSIAERLSRWSPLCYHSRFKLEDRNRRHREVIDRFAGAEGSLLAVTTQVCEMSLDLDADVLISEYASISALIQRMGRCNRHEAPGRPLGDVYLYRPESLNPYSEQELSGTEAFIADLMSAETVSQTDLEERLEHYSRLAQKEPERLTAFLDDGPWARGGEQDLRDGDDYAVAAILDQDLPRWAPGCEGLVVPVPRKLGRSDPRLPLHLHVAPANHYCERFGFCKHPLNQPQGADA
jgi:CRISPR-associated endonuclease/helicase Cas3